MAQQPTPTLFQKPAWLNCYDEGREYSNKEIERRIFYEYGAVYLSKAFDARNSDKKIPCLFQSKTAIDEYQQDSKFSCFTEFGNGKFCLLEKAKDSLHTVFGELGGYQFVSRNCNGSTTCSGGVNDDWALRTFSDTVFNWFGGRQNSLTKMQWKSVIDEVKDTDPLGKPKPLKDRPKMFSVAIPGGSQHILGLAIDVNDRTSKTQRICGDSCIDTLEKNGWFRTVRFDRFHYTYLGHKESELPSKGLKKVACSDTFTYWVPNTQEYKGYENWRCKDVE
jgi:hypothetical protein